MKIGVQEKATKRCKEKRGVEKDMIFTVLKGIKMRGYVQGIQ